VTLTTKNLSLWFWVTEQFFGSTHVYYLLSVLYLKITIAEHYSPDQLVHLNSEFQ
jgi:hypothetical protein